MKKVKLLLMVGVAGVLLFATSCAKDGATGLDGAKGADGTNGTNGTNGSNVTAADQAAYDAASGVNGARMYDHPLNYIGANQTTYPNAYTNFYRCKSCHGWDLLGKNGVLINKTPSATYPVAADGNLYSWAKQHDIKQLFDAVKNTGGREKVIIGNDKSYNSTHPDYGLILTDAQIWDCVKFLKETAHNVNEFYDLNTAGVYPTGTKTFANIGKGGNAANGSAVYTANCAGCHGTDGKSIDIYCQGLYLGEMFRQDPHEIQHKAIWGMPIDREHLDAGCAVPFGGAMPAIAITDQDIRDMMVMGQDTILFPN